MRHISALKEATITVSTLKMFSPLRIYEFPMKRLKRDIILVYPQN